MLRFFGLYLFMNYFPTQWFEDYFPYFLSKCIAVPFTFTSVIPLELVSAYEVWVQFNFPPRHSSPLYLKGNLSPCFCGNSRVHVRVAYLWAVCFAALRCLNSAASHGAWPLGEPVSHFFVLSLSLGCLCTSACYVHFMISLSVPQGELFLGIAFS